jgi:pimeloyl-ACP methyl ester carboxylesterase
MVKEGGKQKFPSLSGKILFVYLTLLWIAALLYILIAKGCATSDILGVTLSYSVSLLIFRPRTFDVHKGKTKAKCLLAIFFVLPGLFCQPPSNWVLMIYFMILLLSFIFLPSMLFLLELVVLRIRGEIPINEWDESPEALSRNANLLIALIGSLIAIFFGLIFLVSQVDVEDSDDRKQVLNEGTDSYLDKHREIISVRNDEEFTLIPCPFDLCSCSCTTPEEIGMICGYVTVPLYHEEPDRGRIQIPIGILPAKADNPFSDPLFVSQGGPGGSTLDVFPNILRYSPIHETRDIVFIDQRGTRYARPSLECPDEVEVTSVPLDDTEIDSPSNDQSSRTCMEWLSEIDLEAFNTKQSAADIESVRKLLEYPLINYYGVSYGSYLGQYYAAYYPDKLRTLILDGVVPIPLNFLNQSIITHERILEEIAASCSKDPACSHQYPFLMDRLNALITKLDSDPSKLTLINSASHEKHIVELTGEKFLDLIFSVLYKDYGYSIVPFIIEQAERGRFDYLEAHAEVHEFEQVNADGLYNAVVCAEHEPIEDQAESSESNNAYLTVHELESREAVKEECMDWDISPLNGQLERMPVSDIPTLMLSGYFDPITPPEYGEEAASSFPHGQHIVDPIGSHGVAFSDNCTENIVSGFLEAPDAIIDQTCLEDLDRRMAPVPADAIASPFLYNLLESDTHVLFLVLFPIVMIGLMTFRGIGQILKYAWNWSRRQQLAGSNLEKRVRRLFELSTWTYCLGTIGMGIGIYFLVSRAFDERAYLYAMALPAEIQLILLLPLGLLFALPVSVVSGVYGWQLAKSKKEKAYIMLQVVYGLGMVANLAWLEILTAWAG